MNSSIQQLIDISRFYGKNKDFVIAGGGNTSLKDEKYTWVKASGTSMANITENGFSVLEREKLKAIANKQYSQNSSERENQIKTDLFRASAYPEMMLRPSVEASLHDMIGYKFVVHTHPTLVNALMSAKNAAGITKKLFGEDVLFVPYTDPGYVLFKKIEKDLANYRLVNQSEPNVIFLQNHGVFVGADTVEEIYSIYDKIISVLQTNISTPVDLTSLPVDNAITGILPAIRAMLTEESPKTAIIRHHPLVKHFYKSKDTFEKISLPFSPDIIVYCKARAIYVENTSKPEEAISEFSHKLDTYKKAYGYAPKIIVLKDFGFVAVEDNYQSAEIALDVFEDLMKISFLSENFGGPKFLNEEEIAFIDNWEVENYRRQVSKGAGADSKVANKIIVVTGGAQGFGAGIAEDLMAKKANVVIADLNEAKGLEMATALNAKAGKNKAVFIKADVSNAASVQTLIAETVKMFGGLDVLISNAGILRAGGLDEMSPETFELMTKVNYTGYFLCAKYASEVLKLQSKYKPGYFTDIIQINSKSGLKGSNKNFAYAGGKFGGIGLTESFALELMPYKIKVNSVCPGNFFDGPLWSDPDNGLFVQYLKAGKVSGARTIGDVKAHYEKQVPAGRGCEVTDVMRAICYIIEQEYETGQAVPVTGGQEMLK
jgi:rhamnose utilization protein RhaD (predicted bifunctional aldolase and dehydrogenase)/NAD(P)-dependent dehydrogenase (short-subunit alcohol dehydrogenase family)